MIRNKAVGLYRDYERDIRVGYSKHTYRVFGIGYAISKIYA